VTAKRNYIHRPQDDSLVTRRDVLAREWEIVKTARDGVSAYYPLLSQLPQLAETLSEEQRNALTRLLSTRDFITLFRGGAGTGKSFVLKELADELQANGRSVTVLAPQRQQVIDLQKSGLPKPTTVADFLNRPQMPERGVMLVDEAGQIGARQMVELIRVVNARKGRIIFSGDTRQHGPVEASDALLALERYAQLQPAELETIRRQDPQLGRTLSEKNQIRRYRQAVKEAAAGRLAESFDQLAGIGAVKVCGLEQQQEKLAEEYVILAETGQSLVVVAQTWAEVNRVNERVRAALKNKGLVAAEEKPVEILDKLDLTTAQKRDERFAVPNQPVVFNQPVRGLKPGTSGKIFRVLPRGVLIEVDNKLLLIPHRQLDRINICRAVTIPLAQGDRLQIKANRRMASGKMVTNGELVTVKNVRADGRIDLADGRTLDASFREFLPGYAVTSYGSQGKTVDYVLFSDSAVRTATDRRQWYVTISRGRRGIRIFTPDKEQLRENVIRSGDQPLALDLVSDRARELFSRRMGYHRWGRLLNHLSPRLRFILPHIWHMENYRRMTQTQTQTHGQQTT